MGDHLRQDFTKVGFASETTPRTFESGGTFLVYPLVTGGPIDQGTTLASEVKTARGTMHPSQGATFWRDFTANGEMAWLIWNQWFEWFLRSGAFPGTETTVTGSSNVNMVTGATHYDGTTGWAITAPTGTFSTFIALANTCEGTLLRSSAWTEAANNHPRRLKWAWETGSVSQLDIDTRYTQNPTAGAYGCVPIADTLESPVLKVGSEIRDQASYAAAATERISMVGSLEDAATGIYKNGYGMLVDGMRISAEGAGHIKVEFRMLGWGADDIATSFPGGGSFSDASGYSNPFIIANSTGLDVFAVGGWRRMEAVNLNGFNFDFAGNADSAELSGSDDRGSNSPGTISGTANFSTYNDETMTAYLDALCSASGIGNQTVIDLFIKDSSGNRYDIGILNACFPRDSGHSMEGTGRSEGTFAPTISEASTTSRQIVIQKFTA
jgi:hypothetical protein